ncbi:unnamed protein product [Owenia fusiformis]|uniref:Uncharacterized protein n=1 Tax=Owenia fusiformis TaxID=6347 RepID=A0A8J1TRY5_OWEFU|nr:unnamed protein product [Owenia fusiformis]
MSQITHGIWLACMGLYLAYTTGSANAIGYTYQYDHYIKNALKMDDVDGYPVSTWVASEMVKFRKLCRNWCSNRVDCTSVDFDEGNGDCWYQLGPIDYAGKWGGNKWDTGGGNYHMRKIEACDSNTALTFDNLDDSAFESSSVQDNNMMSFGAQLSRLSSFTGWFADPSQIGYAWIQVTFPEIRIVASVTTQEALTPCDDSCQVGDSRAKSVNVLYRSSRNDEWTAYKLYGSSVPEILNTDSNSPIEKGIQIPFKARQVRLVILDSSHTPATRWDLSTCVDTDRSTTAAYQKLGTDSIGSLAPLKIVNVRSLLECHVACREVNCMAFNYQYHSPPLQNRHECQLLMTASGPLISSNGYVYYERV